MDRHDDNIQDDKLLDHDYDGIRELDNNLPPWWLNLFYFTIVFAIVYVLYYHVFDIGYSQVEQYKKEMNPNYEKESSQMMSTLLPVYQSPLAGTDVTPQSLADGGVFATPEPKEEAPVVPENFELLTDAASLESGKKIWTQNCVACHGTAGEGSIGPNMADNYWIHGEGKVQDLYKVIRDGVPAKGMISWTTVLTPQQMLEVASYALEAFQGTNPPNAKAPEGTEVTGD